MNQFLAKSNPRETIQEHTDNLLENFHVLKAKYPRITVDWKLLWLACLIHDLGKMNLVFQQKVSGGGSAFKTNEIPHGYLSVAFVPFERLEDEGYLEYEIRVLFQAIARHHERKFHRSKDAWKEEISKLEIEWDHFEYGTLKNSLEYHTADYIPEIYFHINDQIFEDDDVSFDTFRKYVLLKGLLNRIDFAASAGIGVEKPNDFLELAMTEQLAGFRTKNPDADWKPLQKYMHAHQDENVIVVAETGMGKTEAGLLWLGDHKGFFTLPLRTAINAIYSRLIDSETGIIKEFQTDRVGLLHSETYGQYLTHESHFDMDIDEYYTKTRQMSLPITVCTLDQLFDFVFRYAGFEPKLATLSYSKVIIDEVQMYSPDLLAYLIVGLSYIQKVGGKFTILTATLPGIIPDLLAENGVSFTRAEEDFISNRVRHSVQVVHEAITSDFIQDFYDGNRILVICNTVRVAKTLYEELVAMYGDAEVRLLHSQFIKRDRSVKEEAILLDGHKNSDRPCIWIATQVVEASLDIDFDVLFTELSDLNGLFQRMGRCYRNRALDVATNVYVFDEDCSGVAPRGFIDEQIHDNSKAVLQNCDGPISEAEKLSMIDQVYSTEALEGSKYYDEVKGMIGYVKSFKTYELDKKEVQKRFRNINSVAAIPESIYRENKVQITGYMETIKTGATRKDKMRARTKLSAFMLDVPGYIYEEGSSRKIEINKYEQVIIFDCHYDEGLGLTPKEKEQENPFF
ncbi:CRISPR-associated helicase/endonuclease Cas3 [Listeria cornellensis]|uniref:CRISPR-associated helicase Cas3 n=1 Tax=Listeria cornellensis FSL F6-0969 TaxID=1265820 RepID=W7C6F8_9LIST|nr:CRISPR-associated helicase/endonuclease Cas3 [Listeria cornellensis]EUJ32652.1 CRISPR-associated helicase Cas3 [Listeria cornellensis FSL F6-0969]